ncbi:MAG: hypothetical protein IID09_02390, partial [Candidatus Hydrogenedentes bacterium]|nr:hypothetical protein [Candidatus Hydrogenedentota bacterium]
AVQLGGTGDEWEGGIAVDDAGNPHVTGSFMGSVDFDPGSEVFVIDATGLNFNSLFIAKYNSGGAFIWAKNFAGLDNDSGFEDDPAEIALDDFGNVYVAGDFFGTVDFDPGPGAFDMTSAGIGHFVVKLSAGGNFLWAIQFEGGLVPASTEKRHAIALDSSNNVVVAGAFAGSVDFDPGASVILLDSSGAGTDDIYVCKLDTDGNFIWVRQFTGEPQSEVTSLAVDLAGSVYTTGVFSGDYDFDPGPDTASLLGAAGSAGIPGSAFVGKLSPAGDFDWAMQIVGTSIGTAVTADTSGEVFVAGSFEDTVLFGGGASTFALSSAGGIDMFIMRQAALDGAVLDVEHVSGAGNVFARDLVTDNENNFLLVGEFEGAFSFDPGAITFSLSSTFALSSAGGLDVFVGRLGSPVLIMSDGPGGGDGDSGNHGIFGTGVCFIATAAYGTPLDEDIHVLRTLRDRHLLTNTLGLAFVDSYYRISPPIADKIAGHALLRALVRALLAPLVIIGSLALTSPGIVIPMGIASAAFVVILFCGRERKRGRA